MSKLPVVAFEDPEFYIDVMTEGDHPVCQRDRPSMFRQSRVTLPRNYRAVYGVELVVGYHVTLNLKGAQHLAEVLTDIVEWQKSPLRQWALRKTGKV